ncbi:DUF6297 family protein [Actinoplanes couchii]|uniref:ABC-2 type transport system permease protein n=1 Tax=Actinoplanes couchii TaxID=403638 RepID=A0ABQ3X5T8_9ACTN|nr:DUF6297 family protein [Actinoplanes couchii]MDR6325425.1 hypothetical protein [Actinoplanes couchii]GID53872.1 hypothetical protein Aco03nite_022760 [Actinoplanes couchii]
MSYLVELRPVRRWIRRTRASHRERGETLGTAYTVVFCIGVTIAIFNEPLAAVFTPLVPHLTGVGALAAAVVCAALLFLGLRRLGPVTVSRPASYFLLTAPVSRRRLLAPSLHAVAAGAGLSAAAITFAVLGHALAAGSAVLVVTGALVGVLLTLLASAAQRRPHLATATDAVARVALALGLATLVAEVTGWTPPEFGATPATSVVLPLTGALAVLVTAAYLAGVRDIARTPNAEVLESAKTAGTLADTAYSMEPSFLSDMLERRYWARRRLRSTTLHRRLPPLTAQDLLLARRRTPRLLWTAASTALPLLLTAAPPWLLALTLVLGSSLAARATTATVKTDATNPVLLRLLGLDSRQAVRQRFWIPLALATTWSTVALALLQTSGALPPGQWWLLGAALGPIGAISALRAARSGMARNDLIPIDTPMGSLPTGPLLHAFSGIDMLILAVPTVIQLSQGWPAAYDMILFQLVLAVAGTQAYLTFTTDPTRLNLSPR